MKPKDDVFKLVKSLTKAEKRFFNLFSALSEGDKNYVRLFNALDKMPVYDEAVLKQKLSSERFLKNLSYEKNYLFKMLLRALRIFHDESDARNALHSRFIEINVLTEKGLYFASRETIRKAKEIAVTYHKNEFRIALLRLETELDDRTYDLVQTENNIEHHYDEMKAALSFLDAYNRYKKLFDSFWLHARQRREAGLEKLHKLMEKSELKAFPEKEGFHAQKFYLSMHSSYNMFCGKIKESLHYTEKLVELIQQHPKIIEDQPKTYYASLNNLLGRYIYLGEEKKFHDTLEKFKSLPQKVNAIRKDFYVTKVAVSSSQLELEYYIQNKQEKKAFSILPKVVNVLNEHEKNISEEHIITMNFTIASVYFLNGQCKDALRHIHRIVNNSEIALQRIDLQCCSRLMRIFCYHDMNDPVGVELAVKDLKRLLKKESLNYSSLTALLPYFSKFQSLDDKVKKQELATILKKINEIIAKSDKEKTLIMQSCTLKWLAGHS